ncbi:hypothetical protein CBG46_04535 [Actinobacillus succinogenes]|uniref:hypothetical protein n=1 Tax=Actinobacillus succinogenes TaxID=67854 RepID=UPI00030F0336|nr:hypothetical protein [Actinobacillus succinogenes]PHI39991.1 hypothetical protein CBG46_04535 [Actinobacillus succinogenes]
MMRFLFEAAETVSFPFGVVGKANVQKSSIFVAALCVPYAVSDEPWRRKVANYTTFSGYGLSKIGKTV